MYIHTFVYIPHLDESMVSIFNDPSVESCNRFISLNGFSKNTITVYLIPNNFIILLWFKLFKDLKTVSNVF